MKTFKKAFTLMETLIVLTIIGILSVSLIKSYTMITELAFTIEQEKILQNEALLLQQTLQAIADDATIDYEKYSNNLSGSQGRTGTLRLTGGNYMWASIYTTGEENCLDIDINREAETEDDYQIGSQLPQKTWCQLVLKQGGDGPEIPLINNKILITSEAKFKITPYDSIKNLYSGGNGNDIYNNLYATSFTAYLHFYSKFYDKTGQNKIDLPLTLFFNMNESYNDTTL